MLNFYENREIYPSTELQYATGLLNVGHNFNLAEADFTKDERERSRKLMRELIKPFEKHICPRIFWPLRGNTALCVALADALLTAVVYARRFWLHYHTLYDLCNLIAKTRADLCLNETGIINRENIGALKVLEKQCFELQSWAHTMSNCVHQDTRTLLTDNVGTNKNYAQLCQAFDWHSLDPTILPLVDLHDELLQEEPIVDRLLENPFCDVLIKYAVLEEDLADNQLPMLKDLYINHRLSDD